MTRSQITQTVNCPDRWFESIIAGQEDRLPQPAGLTRHGDQVQITRDGSYDRGDTAIVRVLDMRPQGSMRQAGELVVELVEHWR